MSTVEFVTRQNVRFAIGRPEQLGLVAYPNAPRTTADVMREFAGRIHVAVDGPMFEFCRSERQREYERYTCGTARFAHYYPQRGVDIASSEPTRGVSIFVEHGEAKGEAGAGRRRSGETFRVQAYPSLVLNGVETRGLTDTDRNKRPAVGVLSDGRVFLALATSISMPDLAHLLATVNLGTDAEPVRVSWAGYLDGGGSGAMYVDANLDGRPEFAFDGRRRVISWVTLEEGTGPSSGGFGWVKNSIHTLMTPSDPLFPITLLATTAVLLFIGIAAFTLMEPT